MSAAWILLIALGIAGGVTAGWLLRGWLGRHGIEAAREAAFEITASARREAEKAKRSAILEAREEIFRQRAKADNDLKSRKGQLMKKERDLRDLALGTVIERKSSQGFIGRLVSAMKGGF